MEICEDVFWNEMLTVRAARARLTNNSIVAQFVDFYHFDGSLYCLSLHH